MTWRTGPSLGIISFPNAGMALDLDWVNRVAAIFDHRAPHDVKLREIESSVADGAANIVTILLRHAVQVKNIWIPYGE